jgi:hypothetical protein
MNVTVISSTVVKTSNTDLKVSCENLSMTINRVPINVAWEAKKTARGAENPTK